MFYNRRDPAFLWSSVTSFFTRLGHVGGSALKRFGFIWVKAPRRIVNEYVDRIEDVEVKTPKHTYELDDFIIKKFAGCAMALK